MINIYHTDNKFLITSKFMEDMSKKKQKIRFSGAGASHQNGSADCTINMVFTMASAILMQDVMICHKDTLSTDFGRQK